MPVAQADAREQLATAIATTRGSYLVYNFGGGFPAPMLRADGSTYEMTNGGHLMTIKAASKRLTPRLLVDSHTGYQSRCERTPGARTSEGLYQASEIYTPLAAWQALGQPTIAINANFFDIRGQTGGSWKTTGCSSPLGAYVDNTNGQGRVNAAVTGNVELRRQTRAFRRQRELDRPDDDDPAGRRRAVRGLAQRPRRLRRRIATIEGLLAKDSRFVAVSGFGLLAPATPVR